MTEGRKDLESDENPTGVDPRDCKHDFTDWDNGLPSQSRRCLLCGVVETAINPTVAIFGIS
jgi:hypothetical protein